MISIDKSVSIDSDRRQINPAVGKLLKGSAVVLVALIMLGAAENNWFGYVWRSAQLFVQSDDGNYGIGNSPSFVMDNVAINADGSMTILAVGDIVSCQALHGFKRNLSTVASWVGLDDPLVPSTVAAVQTVELAQEWPNALILALGDSVYRRGTPHEFSDCFDPIWGAISGRTLPTPGNHEYLTPAAFAYFDYWGRQAGPDRRGYYAVEHGNWLILSLNTEVAADPASPQGIWLAETLAATSEQCILAFYHRPAYSSQLRPPIGGSEDALFEQLAAAGVDVILNGHNHLYERTYPMDRDGNVVAEGGTVSFVVGTGGKSMAGAWELASFTEKAVFGAQGILRLDLRDSDYGWAFHSVNTATILDEGSRDCGSV